MSTLQLKRFGIEIRQIGRMDNLYSDVDLILRNNGMTAESGDVSGGMQAQTVGHALHKMLQPDATFYSTTIDECAKLCGIVISTERRNLYHPLHCMKWADMLPDFRTAMTAMILDDFRTVLNPK